MAYRALEVVRLEELELADLKRQEREAQLAAEAREAAQGRLDAVTQRLEDQEERFVSLIEANARQTDTTIRHEGATVCGGSNIIVDILVWPGAGRDCWTNEDGGRVNYQSPMLEKYNVKVTTIALTDELVGAALQAAGVHSLPADFRSPGHRYFLIIAERKWENATASLPERVLLAAGAGSAVAPSWVSATVAPGSTLSQSRTFGVVEFVDIVGNSPTFSLHFQGTDGRSYAELGYDNTPGQFLTGIVTRRMEQQPFTEQWFDVRLPTVADGASAADLALLEPERGKVRKRQLDYLDSNADGFTWRDALNVVQTVTGVLGLVI